MGWIPSALSCSLIDDAYDDDDDDDDICVYL